jgi:hypothetical protein
LFAKYYISSNKVPRPNYGALDSHIKFHFASLAVAMVLLLLTGLFKEQAEALVSRTVVSFIHWLEGYFFLFNAVSLTAEKFYILATGAGTTDSSLKQKKTH